MAYYPVLRDAGIEPESGMYWFDVDFYASRAAFQTGAAPVLNEDFLMQIPLQRATAWDGDGNPTAFEDVNIRAYVLANVAKHAQRAEGQTRMGEKVNPQFRATRSRDTALDPRGVMTAVSADLRTR